MRTLTRFSFLESFTSTGVVIFADGQPRHPAAILNTTTGYAFGKGSFLFQKKRVMKRVLEFLGFQHITPVLFRVCK
jgi:hypothetical protein